MKKAKKILSLLLVIALTATITLSATLAYLTDEDEAVNVGCPLSAKEAYPNHKSEEKNYQNCC